MQAVQSGSIKESQPNGLGPKPDGPSAVKRTSYDYDGSSTSLAAVNELVEGQVLFDR